MRKFIIILVLLIAGYAFREYSVFEKRLIANFSGMVINMPQEKVYLHTDKSVYTVGETAPYSRLGEIEGRIDELTYKGNEYKGGSVTGGGQSVYVIGTNDNTAPTDRNVYSAKRMLKEFLSKTANDTAAGVITFQKLQKFLQGLEAGEAVDSLLSGKGVIIDGSGRVQADRLELRGALVAMELLLNEVKARAGD